jgi:autotransporter-associated beta strand protein
MAHKGHVHDRPQDQTQLALIKETAAAPPGGAPNEWIGDAGASGNGTWTTAADWSNDSVPAASATATFATGNFGYTVFGDATIAGILVDGDQLTFDGAITQDTSGGATFLSAIDNAVVTLDSNAFFTGQGLDFADGTLLEVQGILITTGGTADVVLDDGLDGQIITSGALTVNQLYVQNGASFAGDVTLNAGGNITLDTSSSFGGNTITLLGGGLIYDAGAPGAAGGFNGIGDTIDIAQSGAVLSLAADPGVTLAIGGAITGDGTVLITGGTVELSGANTYTGGTVIQGGTLQVDGPGIIPGNLIFVSDGGVITQDTTGGASPYADTIVAAGTSDTVDATAGTQLVFAGPAGTLTFTGGTGDSTVIGGTGILIATGGSAADLIFGGTSGADQLYTGAGNTTLVGFAGASLFADGAGNVALAANGDNVTLNALAATGNTTLFGGSGSNTIIGGLGTDYAVLGSGTSAVFASHGAVDVFAGSGGLSLDYVVGYGSGGVTNVTGFNVASDIINLTGYANGTGASLLANESIEGGNTVLHFTDNATLILYGATGLTAANFTGS